MTTRTPAVRLQPAWGDTDAVLSVLRAAGPYRPLARYAASDAERRATSGGSGGGFVPPWFRVDVAALGAARVDGGDALLHHRPFVDAARRVFGGDPVVEPTTVYVNVMGPCDYPFAPHLDIPVFRGRHPKNTPPWLLQAMQASGLFEAERIRMATAVSWFFDGPGGDFHYWPDGPDADPVVERSPYDDVAIVADNEATFHGVGPVGTAGPSPTDLTLDAVIEHGPDGWTVRDGGRDVVTYPDDAARITISWKCEVFADVAERDLVRSGADDLTISAVVGRLHDHLDLSVADGDPLDDPDWITAVSAACPPTRVRMPEGA